MADAKPADAGVSQPVAPAPAVWFYLDESKQNAGPVDAYVLAGLLDAGKITVDTLVWAEGLPQWSALKDLATLYSQVYYISASGASVTYAPAAGGTVAVQNAAGAATELAASRNGQAGGKRGAVAAAKPAIVAKPTADPALAEFQAELEALGEGDRAAAADPEAGAGRVETPPPEDREFEDDDGTVYVWDPRLRKFQPKGEAAAAGAAAAPEYGVEEMTFQADEEALPAYQPPPRSDDGSEAEDADAAAEAAGTIGDASDGQEGAEGPSGQQAAALSQAIGKGGGKGKEGKGKGKKRGAEEVFERIAEQQKRAKEQAATQQQWVELKKNTSVYVTGLPQDVTEQQLAERFSQYGVIRPNEDGSPRVKVYRDKASGLPKGDGLVTFLYEPSVALACKLADEDLFRPDMGQRMRVQPAKFEMHGSEFVPQKRAAKKKTAREKAKLNEKLLGWGGFDDKLKPTQITVILKHLFHPDDFLEQPGLLKELEGDIREECSKLGPVEKIRVFAGNPEGAAMVKFRTAEAADACVARMQGRFFGGRQLAAALWDGYTNHNVKLQESAEQQAARLERFSREIESGGEQQALLQQQRAAEAAAAKPATQDPDPGEGGAG